MTIWAWVALVLSYAWFCFRFIVRRLIICNEMPKKNVTVIMNSCLFRLSRLELCEHSYRGVEGRRWSSRNYPVPEPSLWTYACPYIAKILPRVVFFCESWYQQCSRIEFGSLAHACVQLKSPTCLACLFLVRWNIYELIQITILFSWYWRRKWTQRCRLSDLFEQCFLFTLSTFY